MSNGLQSDPVTLRQRLRRPISRIGFTVAAIAVAAVGAIALSPDDGRVVQAVGEPCVDTQCGAGGEFHSITPSRILDTREAGPLSGRKGSYPKDDDSGLFELTVAGNGGLPSFADADGDGVDDNVLAVAVNIVVVGPTRQGHLRAFGTGATENETALVNFTPGVNVANSAILRPGEDGKLTFRLVTPSGAGSADVVVDMFGWFSTSSYPNEGARLYPAGPGRIYDSRTVNDPLSAEEQVKIQIRGADAIEPRIDDIVPNNPNVVAALVNVSAVNREPGSTNTYLAAVPDPVTGGRSDTATVNVAGGQVKSALAIVPVASDGSIHVFNKAGTTHVTVDLVGYLIENQDPATRRGRIVPLVSPFRVLDTRASVHSSQPLPPGNAEEWNFEDFVNDVRIGSDPVGGQLGLIGNLTGAELSRQFPTVPVSSYLTAYPSSDGGSKPLVANLTMPENSVVPNMAMLQYGTTSDGPSRVTFYNRAGFMHYVLDVSAVILDD
jgi:hypothetical protein